MDEHGTTEQPGSISFTIKNSGVGPARVDTVELFYKGVPEPDGKAFLKSCCAKDKLNFSYSTIVDEVLPAREEIDFLILPKQNQPGVWDALNAARTDVRLRVCYCSVFEECFVRDTDEHRPKRVSQCTPSQKVTYQ